MTPADRIVRDLVQSGPVADAMRDPCLRLYDYANQRVRIVPSTAVPGRISIWTENGEHKIGDFYLRAADEGREEDLRTMQFVGMAVVLLVCVAAIVLAAVVLWK